jgi:hypothetical protein
MRHGYTHVLTILKLGCVRRERIKHFGLIKAVAMCLIHDMRIKAVEDLSTKFMQISRTRKENVNITFYMLEMLMGMYHTQKRTQKMREVFVQSLERR